MEPKDAAFLAEWIDYEIQGHNQQKTAETAFMPNPPLVEFTGSNLCDYLKDGRVFCLLLSALDAKAEAACRTLMRNPQQMSTFHRLERVQFFIKWCRDELRLDEKDLFTTTELVEDSNERVVCECLTALLQKTRPEYHPGKAKAAKRSPRSNGAEPQQASTAPVSTTSSTAASESTGSNSRLTAFMKRFSGNSGAVASDETIAAASSSSDVRIASKEVAASLSVQSQVSEKERSPKKESPSTTPPKSTSRLTIPSAFAAAKAAVSLASSSSSSSSNAASASPPAPTSSAATSDDVPRSHGKLQIPAAFAAATPATSGGPSSVKSSPEEGKLKIPSAFAHGNAPKSSPEPAQEEPKPAPVSDSKLSMFLNTVSSPAPSESVAAVSSTSTTTRTPEKPVQPVETKPVEAPVKVEPTPSAPSSSQSQPPSSNSKLAAFLAEQHSPPLVAGAPSLPSPPVQTLSAPAVEPLSSSTLSSASPSKPTPKQEPQEAMPPPSDTKRTASSKLAAFLAVASPQQEPVTASSDPPPYSLKNPEPVATPIPAPASDPTPVPTPAPISKPQESLELKMPSPTATKRSSSSKLAAFLAVQPPTSQTQALDLAQPVSRNREPSVNETRSAPSSPTFAPAPVAKLEPVATPAPAPKESVPTPAPVSEKRPSAKLAAFLAVSPPSSTPTSEPVQAPSVPTVSPTPVSPKTSPTSSPKASPSSPKKSSSSFFSRSSSRDNHEELLSNFRRELETQHAQELDQVRVEFATKQNELKRQMKQLASDLQQLRNDKMQLEQKNKELAGQLANEKAQLEQKNMELTDRWASDKAQLEQKNKELTDQLASLQQAQSKQDKLVKQLEQDKEDLLTSIQQMEDLVGKANASEEASRFAAQCAFRARDEAEEEIERLKAKLNG